MREFIYKVKDPMGLHARPASLIFMEARKFLCEVEASCGDEKANAKNLLALMGLGAREGEQILFRFTGEDEEAAAKAFQAALEHSWFGPAVGTRDQIE